MATTVADLQVVVSADTSKAESGLSSFSGKLGSVGSSMALAFGAAAVGGIVAVGAGLAAATGSAAGFEAQMSAVKAVSGSTAAEMEQLRALALELGASTAFSALEAAQGIEELVKAGVSIEDVIGGGAAAAMNLAAAGAISVGEAAELTSNALNAFGLKGGDAARVADTIAGAANASAISVGDFRQSLAAVGAVANLAGVSFEDTAVSIALLGQAGIKGSDAGTSLKTMFQRLIPQTKEQVGIFRELGILTEDGSNKFFDAAGNVKSMSEVSEVLKESLEGMTAQQKLSTLQTMFGADAIRAAAVLADAGAEGFDKMAESMSKVTAEAVAQERLNNLSGAWEELTGALETAAITLGSHLLPPLTQLVKFGDQMISDLIPALDGVGAAIGGALAAGVTKAQDLLRQLADAYRTVKQVFTEGGWSPSAEIEPLANAAGIAATKVRDLAAAVQQAADKAGQMGAWDNFSRGMGTLGKELGVVSSNLGNVGEALGRLNELAGGASGAVDVLAGAIKTVGVAFELWALSMGQIHDTLLTFGSITLDMIGMAGNLGKAFLALAQGDMPAFEAAQKAAAESFVSAWTDAAGLHERSAERASAAFAAISGSAGTEMAAANAAVETNMAAANAAVETGSSGMQGFMEANMTSMAGSTEAGMTQVAAAVDTGMAAAVGGIEAAAPQMAAAAEAGASGAVAAVQGQAGAAGSAGQALGAALGSGLEGGIMAYVGRVASAAANLVSSAIGAARAEADARSPSRKMAKLGKDMVDGIEGELAKADLGPEIVAQIRDMMDSARAYVPTAREIARVEGEIKEIRERGRVEALFRDQEMVTVASELLRLKRDQVEEERRLLPIRQDLAAAEREVRDISQGSLKDRTELLSFDSQRKALRLQTLDLEKALVLAGKDESRKKQIQDQIDRLRDQDRLLGIEADKIRTSRDLAADASRARVLGLGEILTAEERNISAIGREIEVLSAEEKAFVANEAIIKNATENEIKYRERLIEVLKSEGKPLADRMTAGLALIEQLKNEGTISDELAGKLKSYVEDLNKATGGTANLGTAAATAAPQLAANAQQMSAMAMAAAEVARRNAEASASVSHLASSLGKLPSWFTPKGGSNAPPSLFSPVAPVLAPPTGGGGVPGGSIIPGQGTVPGGSIIPMLGPRSDSAGGGTQTHRVELTIGGQAAAELYVTGREVAIRYGRATS